MIELTICHESNFSAAFDRKSAKYNLIELNLTPRFTGFAVKKFYIQISTLGFIDNIADLATFLEINPLSTLIKNDITSCAIKDSFNIYCIRNSAVWSELVTDIISAVGTVSRSADLSYSRLVYQQCDLVRLLL